MTATAAESEFLNEGRLEKMADINAELLSRGAYWIHRRKESVVVMDETALRRTVSVDFTLPERVKGAPFDAIVQRPEEGEPVFCPPLFVLRKASNELMSFDLLSESGVSLPLMTKHDNARVSAATLVALAERYLRSPPSSHLAKHLSQVASADTFKPLAVQRLVNGARTPGFEQMSTLNKEPIFVWWLWTLAHSSLVGVPYRDPTVRRKIFALSYVEEFVGSMRWRTRLGWSPYKMIVDSSWIEARNFHFEAESPRGLRIAEATFVDDHAEPSQSAGAMRRVHMSRYEASAAGAGTARLDLRVNGHGFLGGAVLAATLVVGAVFGCLAQAENIVLSPTSAPSLLLALPGLIATYVARPDQHALTTRLLSSARKLLMLSAAVAYACAAFVALSGEKPTYQPVTAERVSELELVFWIGGGITSVALAGLLIGWLLSKPRVRSLARGLIRPTWLGSALHRFVSSSFVQSIELPLSSEELWLEVREQKMLLAGLKAGSYFELPEQASPDRRESIFHRRDRLCTWELSLRVEDDGLQALLICSAVCTPRLLARPVRPLLVRREIRAMRRRLRQLAESDYRRQSAG